MKRLYLEGKKIQFTRTNTTAALDEQPEENRLLPSTASSLLKSAPCTSTTSGWVLTGPQPSSLRLRSSTPRQLLVTVSSQFYHHCCILGWLCFHIPYFSTVMWPSCIVMFTGYMHASVQIANE